MQYLASITSLVLFLGLFFSGCGEIRTDRVKAASQIGKIMNTSYDYSVEELGQGYATCLALKAKNSTFRTERLGQTFSFELEHTNCNKEPAITTIHTKLRENSGSSGPLTFEGGPAGAYFAQVETHAHGLLSTICPTLLKGVNTQNTYVSGDKRIQVRFVNKDGMNLVYIYTGSPDVENAGEYKVIREDVFTVQIGGSSTATIVGMLLEREQRVVCSGGAVETLKQAFLNHSVY